MMLLAAIPSAFAATPVEKAELVSRDMDKYLHDVSWYVEKGFYAELFRCAQLEVQP